MKKIALCSVLSLSILTLGGSSAVRAQEGEQRVALDAFDGKLHLEKGDKYKLRYFARTEQKRDVPGPATNGKKPTVKVVSILFRKLDADYEVISVDKYGNHQARITYGTATTDRKRTADGKLYTQDQNEVREQNEHLQKLKGISFTVKINPEGKVIGINGLDAARQRIYRRYDASLSSTRASAKATLRSLLSEEAATERFGGFIGPLPPYPMRVSESWNYTIEHENSMFGPPVSGHRTLASLADGVANLKGLGTFKYDSRHDEKSSSDIPGEYAEFTGTQNTFTRTTVKTGMPLEIVDTHIMHGNVHSRFDPTAQKGEIHTFPLLSTTMSRWVIEKQ